MQSVKQIANLSSHVDLLKRLPKMVDISDKKRNYREARAQAYVIVPVLDSIKVSSISNDIECSKGSVFSTAIIAGVMAAKRTADIIPFCHQINLDCCDIKIDMEKSSCLTKYSIKLESTVKTTHGTGVEMEALMAVSSAALCVYDMLKSVTQNIIINDVCLIEKKGGKSDFKRI